jgi:8-oxo-dGTP pyrophosphatase MutT (NUDIX family)
LKINTIEDFLHNSTESGVGLALQNDDGLYLFFLAGKRHQKYCPPGELFYGGIGGHLEEGEDLLACAHREAKEEIGADIDILTSSVTWYVSPDFTIKQLELKDKPQPYALYEHVYPPEISHVSRYYHIVIYKARIIGIPGDLPQDELQGVIGLTSDQLIHYLDRKPTIDEMISNGVQLIVGEHLDGRLRLYSIGTPRVLALIFRYARSFDNT